MALGAPLNRGCCLIDKVLAQEQVLFIIALKRRRQPSRSGRDVTPAPQPNRPALPAPIESLRMFTSSKRTHLARLAALSAARVMGVDRAGTACRMAAVQSNTPTRPE